MLIAFQEVQRRVWAERRAPEGVDRGSHLLRFSPCKWNNHFTVGLRLVTVNLKSRRACKQLIKAPLICAFFANQIFIILALFELLLSVIE